MDSKALPGSYEDTRGRVGAALQQRYTGTDVWVMDTFADHVFYMQGAEDGPSRHYRIGYAMDDAGAVTLEDEPTEVERVEAVREKGMPYATKDLLKMSVPFELKELKAADDGDGWQFEGYASVFDVRDRGGDMVRRGAFKKSLRERDPKLFWRHDEPIGTLQAKEDDVGLFIRGTILPTSLGKDAYILLKGGAVDRLSIGWLPREGGVRMAKEGGRDLVDIDLFEVSPVPVPMLDSARITSVKEDGRAATVDEEAAAAARSLLAAVADQRARFLRRAGDGDALSGKNLEALAGLTMSAGDAFVELLELEMKARTAAMPDGRLSLLRGMVLALATMIDSVPDLSKFIPQPDDDEEDVPLAAGSRASGRRPASDDQRGSGRKDADGAAAAAHALETALIDRIARHGGAALKLME